MLGTIAPLPWHSGDRHPGDSLSGVPAQLWPGREEVSCLEGCQPEVLHCQAKVSSAQILTPACPHGGGEVAGVEPSPLGVPELPIQVC